MEKLIPELEELIPKGLRTFREFIFKQNGQEKKRKNEGNQLTSNGS